MIKQHEHQISRTCMCSIQAYEPSEQCPQHGGGGWPPQCEICGQFMPYPKPMYGDGGWPMQQEDYDDDMER